MRGRLEAEALQHHSSQPLHAPTPQEQELTRLNVALINTDDPKKRDALMSAIYQTEISLGPSKLAAVSIAHPVPLPQLQRVLSQDQLLIEYVLANPTSYALAITRSGVHAYPLPSRAAIEASAKISQRDPRQIDRSHTCADPVRELLAPIKDYAEKRDLVVVPDGQLHLLPFSALVNKDAYVLASHTVDVVPSSTAFAILIKQAEEKEKPEMPYIGVAAWTQNSDSRNPILRAVSGPERSEFVPLPHSEAEVETIAHDLPSPNTILLGANATETRFKELSAESTGSHPSCSSRLRRRRLPRSLGTDFAPEANGPDDGLLQAREIRELHIEQN